MMKILIADDEVIERTVLEKKLKKNYEEDCRILIAQNGRQVIEIHDRQFFVSLRYADRRKEADGQPVVDNNFVNVPV